jgi:hypothetical protein
MAIFLLLPVLAASLLTNSAYLHLLQAPEESNAQSDVDSTWGRPPMLSVNVGSYLASALTLRPGFLPAKRGLVWAAAANRDHQAVLNHLDDLPARELQRNLSLRLLELTAASSAPEPSRVIALQERAQMPEWLAALPDIAALAHMQRGAEGDLEAAQQLRPGDLYVGYQRWQAARAAGEEGLQASVADELRYFPLSAINPKDSRLLDYVAETIPDLLTEGLWGASQAERAVSFLVWQHSDLASVERLMLELSTSRPQDVIWPAYLAELYLRRDDRVRALEAYGNARKIDSVRAEQLIGDWIESRSDEVRVGSDDEFSGACEPDMQDSVGRWELVDNTNPDFEIWSDELPAAWIAADYAKGPDREDALCVAGPDSLGAFTGTSARVSCLWFRRDPKRETGRFGLWLWFEDLANKKESTAQLLPESKYDLSARYRTRLLADGDTRVSLPGGSAGDLRADGTDGRWKRARVVGVNRSGAPLPARPLLTVWSEGDAWFDSVRLCEGWTS